MVESMQTSSASHQSVGLTYEGRSGEIIMTTPFRTSGNTLLHDRIRFVVIIDLT